MGENKPGEPRLRTYVGVLAAFAMVLAGSWVYLFGFTYDTRLVFGTVILGGLVLLGDLYSLRVSEQSAIGAWDIALIAAVVMVGPTWATFAAIPSAILVGGRDPLRTAYELAHSVTIVHLAGIVFSFISGPILLDGSAPLAAVMYGTLISGVVLTGASDAVGAATYKVKYDRPLGETWQEVVQPYLLPDLVNVLTATFGVLALVLYGPVAALVTVAGAMGSQILVYRSRGQVERIRELTGRLASVEDALASSNTTFATMIIRDLGRRDGYTHRHAAATAAYAADLGQEMRLEDYRVGRLRIAGLLHNVGLFGLPEDLLVTVGRPNSVAQAQLSEHPARGEEVLAAVPEFGEIASWVRWHHERPDGRGYPDKLRGSWIPVEAQILAVAQAYAAMVLDGPRRPGMSPADARRELSKGVDTQFDGMVVRAFLRILDTESEGYRMADDQRFAFPSFKNGGRPEGRPEFREGGGPVVAPR